MYLLLWWIPCMAAAIVWIYLYLLATRELKMQIAAIRAERDKVKQDAALAEMEGDMRPRTRPAARCWTPCLPPKVCTASSTAST